MTLFWIGAAVLVLGMALLVLAPLLIAAPARTDDDLRRSQNISAYRQQLAELDNSGLDGAARERAKVELDRMLLEDVEAEAARGRRGGGRLLLIAAIVLPLVAVPLYLQLGASGTIALEEQLAALRNASTQDETVAAMVEVLPALEKQAGRDSSGEYRFLLARIYMTLERYPEAAMSYSQLAAEFPGDAAIAAQYAQALYMAAGNRMTPEVRVQVERANALDPGQVTLLGMLGMDQFQNGEYAAAIRSWERLLAQLAPESADAGIIRDGIKMARAQLGDDAPPETPVDESAGPVLSVAVSLEEGLTVEPGDTVFVFARAESGPPMPLAVQRFPVSELPRRVELSDAQAMMPAMRLSRFPRVVVVARISKSGQPTAQPGDFEGGGQVVDVVAGTQQLEIVIDRAI